MRRTLKHFNERLASIYTELKGYCCFEDNDLADGCALRHKITGLVYCFKDYDIHRGRGKYSECKGSDCEYYCFIDPRQTKITKFF